MKSRTLCTLKELTTSETLSCASEDSKHFAGVWASNSRFTDTHLAVWWQIVKPDLEKQKSFPWQGLHLHSLWMCSELSFKTVGLEQKLTVCFGPCLGAPHCLEVRGSDQALMQNYGRLWKQLSMSPFWSMQECLFPKSCPEWFNSHMLGLETSSFWRVMLDDFSDCMSFGDQFFLLLIAVQHPVFLRTACNYLLDGFFDGHLKFNMSQMDLKFLPPHICPISVNQ